MTNNYYINETGGITSDTIETQKIIRDYYD